VQSAVDGTYDRIGLKKSAQNGRKNQEICLSFGKRLNKLRFDAVKKGVNDR
jgi:hypothetical protein